jgi:para-aminobenzoate synthetase / 4-amino-4-deoxychorismate lyase
MIDLRTGSFSPLLTIRWVQFCLDAVYRAMPSLNSDTPFVLLDDARTQGAAPARLYQSPVQILTTHDPTEVLNLLHVLRGSALHAAGYIGYEAGHALEPRLAGQGREHSLPLLWIGLFDGYEEIAPDAVGSLLPDPQGGWAGVPKPMLTRLDYGDKLKQVKDYISAGDIYQANLTIRATVETAGHPLALYAGLRSRAKAGYGGMVWTGEDWLLSMSPELFFALQGGKITTKPMKGTAQRDGDDAAAIAALRSDPKQRAENLMIVDLLRNDLSRVARPGTVAVPHLFEVETYPTVHQMTSTVTAQLREGLDTADVMAAIFPCGSITGAPKIRAMEVINEVEDSARGVYTGSIGRIDPAAREGGGDAAFNVAIRTLHLHGQESRATLGLGGGIVADSRAGDEWAECLAKGAFVADRRVFDLIETMRFDPDSGIALLDRHLARMKASAAALDFAFDRHAARNELQAATFRLHTAHKVRLLLAPSGRMAIEVTDLPTPLVSPVQVKVVPLPVAALDFRLRHKLTDRSFYDDARVQSEAQEVLFADTEGFLTEGSFTSLFVKQGAHLLTPPLSRGLLPSVLRAELLETGDAVEAELLETDLKDGFFIGNAVRGLLPARLSSL